MSATTTKLSSQVLHWTIIAVGAALMLWPALYNGYPLMNADAGTYLASGFTLETPFDRPITYGLLIRVLSFNGYSLWPLVYAQAVLVTALIADIIRGLVPGGRYQIYAAGTMLLLAMGTPLPWLASQAQPDIFTPIALLCIIKISLGQRSKGAPIALYVLYFVSVAVHMSHPVIMAGTLVIVFLLGRQFIKPNKGLIGRMAILLILSIGSISLMGSALSKSKHVFLMGSLVEKGILKEYLDDNCAQKSLRLCTYKESLPPTSNEFIWLPSSPLYKVGDWKGSKPEFNAIISDVFTTPKYLGRFVVASASATCEQLTTFRMGDGNSPFPEGTELNTRVKNYFPTEGSKFQRSKQNRNELLQVFPIPDMVNAWIVALGIVAIAIYVGRASGKVKFVLLVCVTGIVLNAADTATFSCVQGRYGCRVVWLIPFCAVAVATGKKTSPDSSLS